MTRQERLKFCKTCQNRKFDLNKGILCGLTNDYAAFDESCPDFALDEKIQSLEKFKKDQEENQKLNVEKKKEKKQKKKQVRKLKREPEKIRFPDLILIFSLSLLNLTVIRLISYAKISYLNRTTIFIILISTLTIVVLADILKNREKGPIRFRGTLKFRLLLALFIALVYSLYDLIIPFTDNSFILTFIASYVLTFLLSLISYLFTIPFSLIFKKNTGARWKSLKYLLVGSVLLFATIAFLENNLFVKRRLVEWEPGKMVTYEDFSGYPNFLTPYSAAIYTKFTFQSDESDPSAVEVKALMYPHYSWVKSRYKNSEGLYRHEQYHFNISEVHARKFRKTISPLISNHQNISGINAIYKSFLAACYMMQDRYDRDCDHSVLTERQKDWEFLVDSLLVEYAYYDSDLPDPGSVEERFNPYYRHITIDGSEEILGRYPIDRETALKSKHYRFESQAGKTTRISYYDRNKPARDDFFGVSVIEIKRTGNKEIRYFLDESGQPAKDFSGVYGYRYERSRSHLLAYCLDANGNHMENMFGTCSIICELDPRGRKKSERYFDKRNQRIMDGRGFITATFKYDVNGNLTELSNYNDRHQLCDGFDGIAVARYYYDEMNNLVVRENYDHDYLPANDYNGIAKFIFRYDKNGYKIMIRNLSEDMVPVFRNGSAPLTYLRYDEYGNIIEVKMFGMNRNLYINDDGIGRITRTCDSLGRTLEEMNYDAYGNLLNDNDSTCKTLYFYNQHNNIEKEKRYKNDSVAGLIHHQTTDYIYNDDNSLAEKITYDEEADPNEPDSIAAIKYIFDKQERIAQVIYLNINGRLIEKEYGVAIFKYTYNNEDQRTSVSFFNAEGKPQAGERGCESIRWEYDQYGQNISQKYFHADGSRAENYDGVHAYFITYDMSGNEKTIKSFDYKDQPTTELSTGIHCCENEYNENHLLVTTSFKNTSGGLSDSNEGYCFKKYLYDNKYRLIKITYYDRNNRPVTIGDGYHSENRMLDLNGNIIATIYRDIDDNLVADDKGFAIYNKIYNRNGEVTGEKCFTADESYLDSIEYGEFCYALPGIPGQDKLNLLPLNLNSDARTTYYDNGRIKSQGFYENGKLQGVYTTWYETGQIKEEIQYRDGKRNGLTIDYYPNGVKQREIMYENNEFVRQSVVTWHDNGKIRSKYVKGEQKFWDKKGRQVESI